MLTYHAVSHVPHKLRAVHSHMSALHDSRCSANVLPCHAQVAAFRVAASPVTIGEFYSFAVTARGYERSEFWAPEDYALFASKGQVSFAQIWHAIVT